MLRKKNLRKKAHQLIWNEKKKHQEVYDFLKKEKSDCPREDVAELVSKIPTKSLNRKTQGVRVSFVICMVLIFFIRTADFIVALNDLGVYSTVIYLFHGLTLPTLGIYGALTGRTRYYRFIGVFMILASLGYLLVFIFYFTHWIIAAFSLPFVAAAILSFILPNRLLVPYKKRMEQRELRGRTINVYEYYFQEGTSQQVMETDDLLDL